jgi:hypothetical protein
MPTVNQKKQSVRRKFEARTVLDQLKSAGNCADCGGKFEPCQMDFVHQNKGKPISKTLSLSKKTIIEEIAKCILLCANCSRLRVWKEQRKMRSGLV